MMSKYFVCNWDADEPDDFETFLNREINEDIETGSWRTLNFYKSPFNFPESIEDINEKCTEAGNKYKDKVLSVWNLDSIPFYYKF